MWDGEINAYAKYERAAGSAPLSLRVRLSYLSRLARDHPDPWAVTLDDLLSFLSRPDWKPETRKSARSAVRSFYRWGVLMGKVPVNPASDLPPVRVPLGVPRPAGDAALSAALSAASPRVRKMILLGALAGLRRAEIAAVHSRDITDGLLYVRGKGGRGRAIPLHPTLAHLLNGADGWLFPGPRGHLSADHVGRLLSRALGGRRMGGSAHQLRHRMLSKAYAVERDLRAVQELAGHAQVTTTQIYTAVPQGALRRAVMGIDPLIASLLRPVPEGARERQDASG